MKDAKDLIPWKVTDLPIRPYADMWSFNPSIHFDGKLWRCTLRCSDYAMPNGVTIRSAKARPAGTQTRNAMVILDPATWQVAQLFKMQENDGMTRVQCANVGYEDMRIFSTDRGGLQGIAASLHLDRGKMDIGRPEGATQNQPPEQVLISFDGEYNIVHVKPIRGAWWSCKAQKNWAPFDQTEAPRFLYAIDRGTMFDENGAIEGTAIVKPSASRSLAPKIEPAVVDVEESIEDRERREREERERIEQEARAHEEHERREREIREQQERERKEREAREREKASRNRHPVITGRMPSRGAEVKGVRGRTVAVDTVTSRPGVRPAAGARHTSRRSDAGGSRIVQTGRTLPPRYAGLRGGSQLVHIGNDQWLGIGHEMNFVGGRKNYWHIWFLTNQYGKVIKVSESMKLEAGGGIEFAAGMAIDGDRVVVSFGVDDMLCRIGETSLSAVLTTLKDV